MASQGNPKKGGKYCVCGGPDGVSCTNSVHTPGISVHLFPSEKVNPKLRKLWTKFVLKHRVGFTPTATSVICSAHFEPSCYPQRYALGVSSHLKPRATYLIAGSIPTIDTVVPAEVATPVSARERRKVVRELVSPTESMAGSSLVGAVAYDHMDTADTNILNLNDSQPQVEILPTVDISPAVDIPPTKEMCEELKVKLKNTQKSKWQMKQLLNKRKEIIKRLKAEKKQLNKV